MNNFFTLFLLHKSYFWYLIEWIRHIWTAKFLSLLIDRITKLCLCPNSISLWPNIESFRSLLVALTSFRISSTYSVNPRQFSFCSYFNVISNSCISEKDVLLNSCIKLILFSNDYFRTNLLHLFELFISFIDICCIYFWNWIDFIPHLIEFARQIPY